MEIGKLLFSTHAGLEFYVGLMLVFTFFSTFWSLLTSDWLMESSFLVLHIQFKSIYLKHSHLFVAAWGRLKLVLC